MRNQPNNTFLKNLLKCSIEHVNANAKWQERDKETEWFQKEIYIPTRLDRKLLPDLLKLEYPLVFLSGTPGSGKTQFLKEYKNELLKEGYKLVSPEGAARTVVTFQKNGKLLRIKHDATQVESEIDDAAEKLGELLGEDWANPNFEKKEKNSFYIIGINQGVFQRLLNLAEFKKLGKVIRDRSDPRILIVDLSKRSAVNPRDHEDAFVIYLLLTITDKKHWEDKSEAAESVATCYGCELVESGFCPIITNIQWLRRESVWERIHEIFEMNHFIAGNVTTFRDVIAILAKAIGGYADYYGDSSPCDNIRAKATSGDVVDLMNLSRLLIYNGMFGDEDPYGEYVTCLELPKSERDKHAFYGYCGSYFSSDIDDLGTMAMMDPARSDSDILREQDDGIFNFPVSFLTKPDGSLEKRFFDIIAQELETPEPGDTDNETSKLGRWREKEWLLFCLVRLGRRRRFLLGEESCKILSVYENAESFSETILRLESGEEEGYARQLIGDMKMALTSFSGTLSSGTMKVAHGHRDAEISSVLAFDASFKIYVPNPDTPYIEFFPREIYLELPSNQGADVLGQFPPLRIDLEVWECLKRARDGFSASYLGIERVKSIEAFLQGLSSVVWRLQNCRVEITRGDKQVIIRKESGGIVIQ